MSGAPPSLRRFVRVHPFATRYVEPLEAALLAAFPGTTWEEARRLPDDEEALCFAHPHLLDGASTSTLRRTIVEVRDDEPAIGPRLSAGLLAGIIVDPPEGASLIGRSELLRPESASGLLYFMLPGVPVAALEGVAGDALDYVRALAGSWSRLLSER